MNPLTLKLATPVTSLVLIGGGEFSFGETRAVDESLLSRLPAGRRTVAFVPTASGSSEYGIHFGAYLETLDADVKTTNVPIYRGRDNRRQKNLSMLLSAGLVYLGGGVAANLVQTLRESPAELALRDAAASGALVAAIAASASCFGIHTHDLRGSTLPGLGWIAGTVIEAGFDPADDTGIRRLMSLPDVELGIGIPPQVALVVAGDGSTEIVGEGSIAVFRKR